MRDIYDSYNYAEHSQASGRVTAGRMSHDLTAACARLISATSSELESWRAPGSKATFFEFVQRSTLPFRLTGESHAELSRGDVIEVDAPPLILFLGDSITREASRALRHIMVNVKGLNASVQGSNSSASPLLRSISYHQSMIPTDLGASDSHVWRRQAASALGEAALHNLASCRVDALFLGGYGPSTLLRGRGLSSEAARSPLSEHRKFIRQEFEVMSCIARRTGTPVIFLGSLPFEARTVMLDPAKNDWYRFYEFELATVRTAGIEPALHSSASWLSFVIYSVGSLSLALSRTLDADQALAEIEEAVFKNLSDATAIHATHGHATTDPASGQRQHGSGRVFMLPLRELAESCPHIRCDGVHYESAYSSFGCKSTMAVWYRHLSDFLRRSGLVDPSTRRWRSDRARAGRRCEGDGFGGVHIFKRCQEEVTGASGTNNASSGPIGGPGERADWWSRSLALTSQDASKTEAHLADQM